MVGLSKRESERASLPAAAELSPPAKACLPHVTSACPLLFRWDGVELRTCYPEETMQRRMFLLRSNADTGRIAKYAYRGMHLVPPPPEVQGPRRLSAAAFADLLEEVQDYGPGGGTDGDSAGNDVDDVKEEVEEEAAAPAPVKKPPPGAGQQQLLGGSKRPRTSA